MKIHLTPKGRIALILLLEKLLSDPVKGPTAKRLCDEIGFDYKKFTHHQPCAHDFGPVVKGPIYDSRVCTLCEQRIHV